jgi:hypothetical protein
LGDIVAAIDRNTEMMNRAFKFLVAGLRDLGVSIHGSVGLIGREDY